MAKPRKLPNGRWQISVENTRRGIPRTKRAFATRAEALAWQKAVLDDGLVRLLGGRPARTFGEALARYLREHTPGKRDAAHDHSHAAALRWPYWDPDTRRWHLLEECALEDVPHALHRWTADQKRITARSQLGGNNYQCWRDDSGAAVWTVQPPPGPDGRPRPRVPVTDGAILARLERRAERLRGPWDSGTLRHRQLLAKHTLKLAWRVWGWLEHDLSGKIQLDRPSRAREIFLTREELEALLAAARADGPAGPHFADLIAACSLIGWRRSNIVYLRWDCVRFPQADQLGYLWTDRQHTKNGDPLAHPMGPRLLELFERRREHQHGPYVFHAGTGDPWGDYRKRLARALRGAGLGHIRTHDLRHTWASHAIQDGKPLEHIQDLGGWRDPSMLRRYAHLRLSHLVRSAN